MAPDFFTKHAPQSQQEKYGTNSSGIQHQFLNTGYIRYSGTVIYLEALPVMSVALEAD